MQQLLIYIAIGHAGFLIHSLIKLNQLNNDAYVANVHFSLKSYLIKDMYGLIASFICPFIWPFVFSEVIIKYPTLAAFPITFFFVMGGMGSYVWQLIFGRAKRQINKIVDEKTNIADAVKKDE